jgi:hypothetical protein
MRMRSVFGDVYFELALVRAISVAGDCLVGRQRQVTSGGEGKERLGWPL